ncbi:autophagy protein atg9 [Tilletia horrida]|uniref:Autophagy-related protein 9 n=1 Tax=Tilletia horrida TaxID=155126 RepID=A0AAN6JJE2_9BASI|nr:autophagy protein atg9 [Tilletia horrida]
MDPFEDPDNVEGGSRTQPQPLAQVEAASSAASASNLAAATASPAPTGPATPSAVSNEPAFAPAAGAPAGSSIPSSSAHARAFAAAAGATPAPDLHASASLFGEGAAGDDDNQPQQSVQLSALMLPPAAQDIFAHTGEAPFAQAAISSAGSTAAAADANKVDLEAQQQRGAPTAGEDGSSPTSTAAAASRSGSRRHRHRRPESAASGRRRNESGGGLSSTISSLRRNISRQIERERQQMGLSRSNLRDVYNAGDDEEEEDEEEGGSGAENEGGDRSGVGEESEPGPEDIVDPEQSHAEGSMRSSPSTKRKSGASRRSKGKAGLSDSRVGRGLGASTASVGARRRAMRVMTPKEKALWLWANVENMDAFLAEVYAYYQGKGAYCIALSRTLNLLTIAFVLFFSTFLLGCVDYSAIKHDGLLADVIVPQCVNHFSSFAVLFLLALGAGFVWLVVRFGVGISRLVAMHGFYEHLLNIPDADVQAIPWHEVVNRISALRISNPQDPSLAASVLNAGGRVGSGAAANQKRLGMDAHDIANRIMRQENYMIALFNKDVLNLNVPFQLPLPSFLASILGLSPAQGVMGMGRPKPVLTRSLEWNLHFCLVGFFFDQDGQLNQAVLRDRNRAALVAGLRKRFITMATLNAILAPFIIVYLIFFSFFRYFEEYHKNPANLGSRQFTEYARWKFREFNELPHLFKRRMRSSMPFAQRYTDQFPKERLVILARFVAFIAGSFTAVLLLASLYDPDLFLHFDITPQRNTLFYIGVFGGVLAFARGMIPEENAVVDPEMEIREVIRRTHYYPDEWRGRLHSAEVHADFGTMYMLKVYIFLTEMVSVIMTPFILWLSLPESAPAIVDFFREFTVHVDGLGYVCSFAVFDFKRNGNVRFGAPAESRDERMASKAGKMEQSFLNFKVANPDWLPADPSGSLFLSRLTETVSRHQPHLHHRERTGAGPTMDPYASAIDPYGSASYLPNTSGDVSGGPLPESTLNARRNMYDEAFNRSILLASKPRNAEALAASATKAGARSAFRSGAGSGASGSAQQQGATITTAVAAAAGSTGHSRSRSASGRARHLQAVDEDGDIFGEQPEEEDDDGRATAGDVRGGAAGVDLLASLPPRAMDESALDAPFHSFVGEGGFTSVPSGAAVAAGGSAGARRQAGSSSGGGGGQGGSGAKDKAPEPPLDEQGFKALIGNLYRSGGQPAVRSVW